VQLDSKKLDARTAPYAIHGRKCRMERRPGEEGLYPWVLTILVVPLGLRLMDIAGAWQIAGSESRQRVQTLPFEDGLHYSAESGISNRSKPLTSAHCRH
jgi:hypothetical protein